MLTAVLISQLLLFVLLAVLLLRKPAVTADPRLVQISDATVALGTRLDILDVALRGNAAELRREQAEAAVSTRAAAEMAHRALREEITGNIATLSRTLHEGLAGFRADNAGSAETLRTAVVRDLASMAEQLANSHAETGRHALESRDMLHTRLGDLGSKNTIAHDTLRETLQSRLAAIAEEQRDQADRLRSAVEERLNRLNDDNTKKLEQMRETVDEKLHATLQSRLTESFGQVSTHLGEVQKGLGEMKELANGVSDLKKVFSNVKSRGIVGEFQLGMQLEQMFSREQYAENIAIKPGSAERVEYALRIPHAHGEKLFAIDSKFPRQDWERLEQAYESGSADDISKAGAAFERAIRTEGKRICDKYIHEPVTLPHAILFLPTEGLYAEVMRRPALQSDLQQKCNVTIAGPHTLMAILTSFRMGFHSIALEKKGSEVWKVLGGVKTEFGKFELLMGKVERQVGTVQNTLGEIASKTKTINRNLRGVTELPESESSATLLAFEDFSGVAPMLAAAEGD